ncbi:MAG: TIM barrel protein [Cyclobacteriaceae bacterium]
MENSRREFIKKTAVATSMASLASSPLNLWAGAKANDSLSIHIFSKHLQFLDHQAVGEQAAAIGFDGVDLTVRPGGHVEPEKVVSDLPKAIELIKKGGSTCQMMVSGISNAKHATDISVIKTAGDNGIKFYRPKYFKYSEGKSMVEQMAEFKQQAKEISLLNKKYGIVASYQNHAGNNYVGAAMWEIFQLMEKVDQNYYGSQYDIRHSVVEGGESWETGLRLVRPHIKTIVLKDFKWGKVNGQWKHINTPMGEGMVSFKRYFALLKKYKINVPVSLHLEYPLGGANKGKRELTIDKKDVYKAMKKDLTIARRLWAEA